jgi:hypothetical protein
MTNPESFFPADSEQPKPKTKSIFDDTDATFGKKNLESADIAKWLSNFSLSAEDLELLRPRSIGELPAIDYDATLQELEASNPEQLTGDYLENSADLFKRFREIGDRDAVEK